MKTKKRKTKGSLGIVALLLFLGMFAHLDGSGRTDSWPEVPGTIVGSRIVPQEVNMRPTFVLWKGEDLLRYEVTGRHYSVCTDAVSWNEDRMFIEYSLSHGRPRSYTVRFNPANPSEAVAKINSN
jgi:hypothetical protein